jgi:hypothetical protein
VLIVPIPNISHSPFASNSHPVQPEAPSLVSLPAPTPSTLNSFGQISTVDSLAGRISRFGSEPEVAALIDVVEPFQAPVPANAPNKAATSYRSGATVMVPRQSLLYVPRLDHDEEGYELFGANLAYPDPTAALVAEGGSEDKLPEATPGPRLAFAAALAGAGYWLALRDFKGRKRGWSVSRYGRESRPRVRHRSPMPK